MNFKECLKQLIKHGEGCISHMYLDTVGKVTVGVGKESRGQSLTP